MERFVAREGEAFKAQDVEILTPESLNEHDAASLREVVRYLENYFPKRSIRVIGDPERNRTLLIEVEETPVLIAVTDEFLSIEEPQNVRSTLEDWMFYETTLSGLTGDRIATLGQDGPATYRRF